MVATGWTRRGVMAFGAAFLTAAALGSRADAAIDRLHIIIGTSASSSNDPVDRALAAAIQTVNPAIALDIENMSGSSGRVAFKTLREAPGNAGLVAFLQNGLLYTLLMETDDSVDEFNKLTLIGSIGTDQRALYASTASGITSFADLLAYTKPLIVPTVNATSSATLDTSIINTLTGARLKAVPGFSSPERKLALISGEANAAVGSISTFQDLVDQKTIVPILRLNDAGPDAPFAELPTLASIAKGPDAKLLTSLIEAAASTQQMVVAPAEIAKADFNQLTQLFDAAGAKLEAAHDAQFEPEEIKWSNREAVMRRVGDMLTTPGASDALKRALACGTALAEGGTCP